MSLAVFRGREAGPRDQTAVLHSSNLCGGDALGLARAAYFNFGATWCSPQRSLQLLAGDTVGIVWWRRECDWKVAEGDVEELLYSRTARPQVSGRLREKWPGHKRLTCTFSAMSNSRISLLAIEKARRRLRGSFSPVTSAQYPVRKGLPIFFRAIGSHGISSQHARAPSCRDKM